MKRAGIEAIGIASVDYCQSYVECIHPVKRRRKRTRIYFEVFPGKRLTVRTVSIARPDCQRDRVHANVGSKCVAKRTGRIDRYGGKKGTEAHKNARVCVRCPERNGRPGHRAPRPVNVYATAHRSFNGPNNGDAYNIEHRTIAGGKQKRRNIYRRRKRRSIMTTKNNRQKARAYERKRVGH